MIFNENSRIIVLEILVQKIVVLEFVVLEFFRSIELKSKTEFHSKFTIYAIKTQFNKQEQLIKI